MTNEAQKPKGKEVAKATTAPAAPEAPVEAQVPEAALYTREEHLEHARGMYGVRSPLVAGALSILDGRGDYPDGYTKDEVKSAIDEASTTPIKEG